MFTACGHVSAPGARAAVLSDGVPDALRRTLVLLGLLAGALTTSWVLGTASAQAGELDLTGGVEEVQEQVDGAVEAEVPEPAEAPEGTGVPEIPETPEAPEVPDEPVDELGDTVTDTAHEATGTVDEVTGSLDETVPETPGVDVVGQVHETVDGVTDEVDQRVEDTVPATEPAPETGTGDTEPAPEREHTGAENRTADENTADTADRQAPSPAQTLTERDDRSYQATADDGTEQGQVSPDAGSHHPTATATGTASANGGAPAGAVAGFLPSTGAPVPAPGPEQAALDVLRAVPAADAGEPTVAPD
ncbi:hypothetical protein IDM40_05885 [Nocardiopsis sp. HNM0947]|uniref:Uncharacterized protein n=1 Tax=Nocardiopsis coralli TaxID=2772213 RepID=A0ABR9P3C0_9ACTN|nr:hypothetical protein [Nocardiopsis coralli]MBE2998235.1 hypothetical protein [Nocardiopsis coralli]